MVNLLNPSCHDETDKLASIQSMRHSKCPTINLQPHLRVHQVACSTSLSYHDLSIDIEKQSFISFHFTSTQAEMDMLIISILFGGSLAQAKSVPTKNIISYSDTECRVTL